MLRLILVLVLALVLLLTVIAGCRDTSPPQPKPKTQETLAKPKMTDKIEEFDPTADNEVVDSKVKISNPVTGALEAYGPLKQQISGMAVSQAVEMFRATEGRYPRDYQEFKSKVIEAKQIRLPVPGEGLEYQYDVQNHSLVVVKSKK